MVTSQHISIATVRKRTNKTKHKTKSIHTRRRKARPHRQRHHNNKTLPECPMFTLPLPPIQHASFSFGGFEPRRRAHTITTTRGRGRGRGQLCKRETTALPNHHAIANMTINTNRRVALGARVQTAALTKLVYHALTVLSYCPLHRTSSINSMILIVLVALLTVLSK